MLASDTFIQDTYPVADAMVTGSKWPGVPLSASTLSGQDSIVSDILEVAQVQAIQLPSARNGIGIVPSDPDGTSNSGYFSSRDPGHGTHGASLVPKVFGQPISVLLPFYPRASLVEEGWWPVTAHEIAHTFGVADSAGALVLNGFNVRLDQPIQVKAEATDFMGPRGSQPYFQSLAGAWITSSSYGVIFEGDLVNPADPQVLLLSGIITGAGQLQMNPSHLLDAGEATPFSSLANGEITASNGLDEIVFQGSFLDASQLELLTDSQVSIPVQSTPFLVNIPFSGEISAVEIKQGGVVVGHINPVGELLVSAINAIPVKDFRRDPTHARNSLLNRAHRIEEVLNGCRTTKLNGDHDNWSRIDCTDPAEELLLELRRKVLQTVDDTTTDLEPLQLTRAQVLLTVDFLGLQLLGSPIVTRPERKVRIKIIPEAGKDIFAITSVTQGSYGSVTADGNGFVTYTVEGADLADKFSVTIEDIDGTSVTKFISVVPGGLSDSERWQYRFRR
jgi:hypothetical protein